MLKKRHIAAILSLIGLVSVQILSSSHVLAQGQRPIKVQDQHPRHENPSQKIPSRQIQPPRRARFISGKIYLSDLPPVIGSAKCENITVLVYERVKKPNRSTNGLKLDYIQVNVASTTANGDIKRSYCDYGLTIPADANDYYLKAGAQYQTILGSGSGCSIDSTPLGLNTTVGNDLNRDIKLSRSCIR
ncbi:hypothetical protein NIES4071_12940 [Calothrix sp. NIES-4071]|nr:hypothetical protein NIES4071_12940 [Calothrix sp. NIES-4071]BAZ55634.1 hypothetical protein NIES4105_12900 [Calothrix sp. NIES-4105]